MITSDMWRRLEARDFDRPFTSVICGRAKTKSTTIPKLAEQATRLRQEGKTYAEIAAVIGVKPSSVSAYLKGSGLQKTYQRRLKA